jgi:hypothetical protein
MTQLHSNQDAIKQAVEAGYWRNPGTGTKSKAFLEGNQVRLTVLAKSGEAVDVLTLHLSDVLQDPAFWQSLGKARGWGNALIHPDGTPCGLADDPVHFARPTHLHHALRCFETVLSGGDLKAFWQSLP